MKRTLTLILLGVIVAGITSAQDTCATAIAIGEGVFPGSNVGATTGPDPLVTGCGTNPGSDVWYAYTAGCTGTTTVSFCPGFGGAAGFDTLVAVWTGACGALAQLVCNDDSCGLQSQITFASTSGSLYYISVASYNSGTAGAFTLSVTNSGCPPPAPSNDDCAGAIPLTEGLNGINPAPGASGNTYQMTFATLSAGWPVPTCAGSISADVWFLLVPNNTGLYQISTENPGGFAAGGLTDTVLDVFPDTLCVPGAAIACDQDTGTGTLSFLSVALTAGLTYYVRVSDNAAVSGGSFYVNVDFVGGGAPANDDCTGVLPALALGPNPGSTIGATTSAGFTNPCSALVNDVWFTFTPAVSDCYTLDTENTSTPFGTLNDTVLAVYAGCAAPALLCDNDAGTNALSSVSIFLMGGTTYYVQVGDLGTAPAMQGTFWINITQTGCVPGDDCSTAFPLAVGANPTPAASGNVYSNAGSTTSTGYPALVACSSPAIFRDIWFSFTPPSNGPYTFHTNTPCGFATAGTLTNTTIALYSSCTPGAPIACDADSGSASLSSVGALLTGGVTVYLRVGSTAIGTTGTFYVNVRQGAASTNDDCAGAIPLAIGTNPTPSAPCNFFSNEGATNSAGWSALTACSSPAINNDVWFSFTPVSGGPYIIDTSTPCGFTAGTATNTTMAMYSSCTPGLALACDADSGTGSLSLINVALTGGQLYLIRIGTVTATTGTGTFYVNVKPGLVTPSNDDCTTASPVVLGINPAPGTSCVTFNNEFATSDLTGLPAVCAAIVNDLWFSFTPTTSGDYVIETETPAGFTLGTNTNTTIAVYANCAATVPIACDADSGVTGGGTMSIVNVLGLTAGVPVFIRVGSSSTTTAGSFYLSINRIFSIAFSSPFGPGSLQFDVNGGPPGGTYYLAVSLNAGGFPNGWLYGIDILIVEIISELQTGFPFVGPLNGNGDFTFGPIGGAPSGLTIFAVGLGFPGLVVDVPTANTAPKTYVIP